MEDTRPLGLEVELELLNWVASQESFPGFAKIAHLTPRTAVVHTYALLTGSKKPVTYVAWLHESGGLATQIHPGWL